MSLIVVIRFESRALASFLHYLDQIVQQHNKAGRGSDLNAVAFYGSKYWGMKTTHIHDRDNVTTCYLIIIRVEEYAYAHV